MRILTNFRACQFMYFLVHEFTSPDDNISCLNLREPEQDVGILRRVSFRFRAETVLSLKN